MERSRLTAALAVVALALLLVPAALAKDGDVRVVGTCTGASTSKLKLSPEDGRLEVELEVDQNRSGVRWYVTLRRAGKAVASTSAVTGGRSGSFTVRRVIAPGAAVTAVATRAGETCTARARL